MTMVDGEASGRMLEERRESSELPRSLAGGNNPCHCAVVSIATFMEVLDTSIANVSLTHIAGDLSAGLDESTWVLTSYLVANAIILPISGWLANAPDGSDST